MRWPWTGIEEQLRVMHEDLSAGIAEIARMRADYDVHVSRYEQLTEDNKQFTRECITRMQLATARQEKALDKVLAEQEAQRQGLLRMIDRLGPAPGTA